MTSKSKEDKQKDIMEKIQDMCERMKMYKEERYSVKMEVKEWEH